MPRHKFEGSHQDICDGPAELELGAQQAGQRNPQDVEAEGEEMGELRGHSQGQQGGEGQLLAEAEEEEPGLKQHTMEQRQQHEEEDVEQHHKRTGLEQNQGQELEQGPVL